jgi:lipoprotein-anchoring transpeptidase ErfK/SrfK
MTRLMVLLTALVTGLAWASGPAMAQASKTQGSASAAEQQAQPDQASLGTKPAPRRRAYKVYPKYMEGGARPAIAPTAPPIVYFDRAEEPGSIIIDTRQRKLYYVLPGKKAYGYPVSVGREGFTWSGTERISRIAAWPSWTPPPEMRQRVPGLPVTVSGGIENPQGAMALYLGNTVYRIHGTNNERTVGRANSSGCFRLKNEHVVHLASIAKVGTRVKVLRDYTGGVSDSVPLSALLDFGLDTVPDPKPRAGIKKRAAKAKPAAL